MGWLKRRAMMARGDACPNCAYYRSDICKCGVGSVRRRNGQLHMKFEDWRDVYGTDRCEFARRLHDPERG